MSSPEGRTDDIQRTNIPSGSSQSRYQEIKPEAPSRRCGCACIVSCNCKCSCAHREHCVCLEVCKGQCGARVSRNLVISIDGTSNQFGLYNTNVVELHSRVPADTSTNQKKYYNCGIGTYVPFDKKVSFKYWKQRFDNILDLAIAWNFKTIIIEAYRWLSQTYNPGDKLFFFGFSRGAYQVRTLAAMIETVGLVEPGNEALIPFAYEIYLERHKGEPTKDAKQIAENFKATFSRDVRIHFVGVWDTVSSIGIVRGKPLPLTSSAQHICTFRHALALDERRVKFFPEYIEGGSSATATSSNHSIDVKEVWFAGTHSDIGGGNKKNLDLNLSSVPLLWMENEATSAGLRLRSRARTGGAWNLSDLHQNDIRDSLTFCWRLLEYLPLKRLSFMDSDEITSVPYRGAGRVVAHGQRIHISVALKKGYTPRATTRSGVNIDLQSFAGRVLEASTFDWARQMGDKVELDLFDGSFTIEAIQKLQDLRRKQRGGEIQCSMEEQLHWIKRLEFMAVSGRLATNYIAQIKPDSEVSGLQQVRSARELFQGLHGEASQSRTFDADIATFLEHEAGLLDRKDDAMAACKDAASIRCSVDQARSTVETQKNWANCLEKLGEFYWDAGRFQDLANTFEQIIKLRRSVAKEDSTTIKDLARSLARLGTSLASIDKNTEAVPHFEESLKLFRTISDADATNYGRALRNSTTNLSELNRYEDAVRIGEDAIALYNSLSAANPTSQQNHLATLLDLSTNLLQSGQSERALSIADDALAQAKQYYAHATDRTFAREIADSCYELGLTFRRSGHHEVALRSSETAAMLFREAFNHDPLVLQNLADSLQNLGLDRHGAGHLEEALLASEEAIKLYRQLDSRGQYEEFSWDLSNVLKQSAAILRRLGRNEEALQRHEEGAERHRELAKVDLFRTATWIHDLACDFYNIGRHEDAVDAEEEAVEIYRTLVQTKSPQAVQSLINALELLSRVLRAVGREEDAVGIDEEVISLRSILAEQEQEQERERTAGDGSPSSSPVAQEVVAIEGSRFDLDMESALIQV